MLDFYQNTARRCLPAVWMRVEKVEEAINVHCGHPAGFTERNH